MAGSLRSRCPRALQSHLGEGLQPAAAPGVLPPGLTNHHLGNDLTPAGMWSGLANLTSSDYFDQLLSAGVLLTTGARQPHLWSLLQPAAARRRAGAGAHQTMPPRPPQPAAVCRVLPPSLIVLHRRSCSSPIFFRMAAGSMWGSELAQPAGASSTAPPLWACSRTPWLPVAAERPYVWAQSAAEAPRACASTLSQLPPCCCTPPLPCHTGSRGWWERAGWMDCPAACTRSKIQRRSEHNVPLDGQDPLLELLLQVRVANALGR